MKCLVTGAGGFIGTHLVRYLKDKGHYVVGADIKYPQWSDTAADEFIKTDLRMYGSCACVIRDRDWVFHLAANMGGMGFIGSGDNDFDIVMDNTAIDYNMFKASWISGVERIFYASSACIYPEYKQLDPDSVALKEDDAYPAEPDSPYGWQKLSSEHILRELKRKLDVRIARFHNIYGTETDYEDPRAKLPAAACRKFAETDDGTIDVWGDGLATRSFCHVSDCVEMIYRLMESDYDEPMNIGTDRSISVIDLYRMVADISGKPFNPVHDMTKPQGVRGRNADLSLMKEKLDYVPKVSLEGGMKELYEWIEGIS